MRRGMPPLQLHPRNAPPRASRTPSRRSPAPSSDNPRPPASQINSVQSYFMHEACALVVGSSREWQRINDFAGVEQDVGPDVGDPIGLAPVIGQVVQEHRDVVVRILAGVAASARAEQHDALDAVAVKRVERGAEALQDRIIELGGGHTPFYHNRAALVFSAASGTGAPLCRSTSPTASARMIARAPARLRSNASTTNGSAGYAAPRGSPIRT